MKTNKQYLYNFVDGGWNSEWATSKRGAIKAAKARWQPHRLVIDEQSFRLSTPSEYPRRGTYPFRAYYADVSLSLKL